MDQTIFHMSLTSVHLSSSSNYNMRFIGRGVGGGLGLGGSDRISQQGTHLPIFHGHPWLLFIFYLQWTDNIFHFVQNRKIKPMYKSVRQYDHQRNNRTCRGPKRRYSDSSNVTAPNWYQHWCQSYGHICKILPQFLPWNSVLDKGEVKQSVSASNLHASPRTDVLTLSEIVQAIHSEQPPTLSQRTSLMVFGN